MNKLLMKAIEWLRRGVTAFKSEKLRVKSEKVKDTLCVYADDDKKHLMVFLDLFEIFLE